MGARTECFNCNSSDGLATYSNGTYCFSCKSLSKEKHDVIKKEIDMPVESNSMNLEAANWLGKYNLDIEEVNCFWSDEYKRLCFPYQIGDHTLGCWMRGFDKDKPKWLFAGRKHFSWLVRNDVWDGVDIKTFFNPHDTVCLVEDVVSAIRTSQYIDTICLGGTKLSLYDRSVLTSYKKVIIFLDGDEAGKIAARQIRNELKLQYDCVMIRNMKDPKDYHDIELKGMLNERN